MMKKSLKWTPAQPIRKPDNIISSDARLRNDFGFKPSYLFTERSENMKFIMSNEYMRKWFKERDDYAQELFIRLETEKEETGIKRRYVQRMLIREKKEKHLPIIKLKKFQNIGSKSDHGQKKNGESKDEKVENKSVTPAEKPNLAVPTKQPYQRYKPECVMPKKQKGRSVLLNPATKNKDVGKRKEEDEKNSDSKNDNQREGQVVTLLLPCGQCKCQCMNGLETEKK